LEEIKHWVLERKKIRMFLLMQKCRPQSKILATRGDFQAQIITKTKNSLALYLKNKF
jgi:hypothetical protein